MTDFRSSLRYWPWGLLVGVSANYPTKAVALLLGESKAYGLDNGLAPNRRQAIIWTNDDPVQRRIYALLDLNELTL